MSAPTLSFSRQALPGVIAAAYALSKPQGMGFIHAIEGPIPKDVLDAIIHAPLERCGLNRIGIALDYVLGRALKLTILYDGANDRFFLSGIDRGWFDHSLEQWEDLLAYIQATDGSRFD